MILQLTALLALTSQGAAQAPAPDAGALISKAFTRYYDAKSLSGQIRLSQSAKGVTLTIDTAIQYDRPNQFLIEQVRNGSTPKRIYAVSDGKKFSYDRPEGTLGQSRFIEDVTQRDQVTKRDYVQNLKEMYSAASRSLLDRSAILDIAIGRREDLAVVRDKWGAKKVTGRTTLRGTEVVVIEGAYHDRPGAAATGTFQMMVTEQGDILRYGHTQRYRVPDQTNETIEIVSIWDVDLKVEVKTDQGRYRVFR